MNTSVTVLRWIIRLLFVVSLILGIMLWTGNGYTYLKLHMWLGFIISFALLLLAIIGFVARIRPVLPLVTLIWAVLLPVLGIAQLRIVPGPNHWTIQVLHVIIGIGAIGLAEVLGKRSLTA
ncbi:MAG: hypothetical protein M3Y24_01160 [Acidobacteriota bacterium]|nr:hypothetical protein [Acidobacteriota bacterium]